MSKVFRLSKGSIGFQCVNDIEIIHSMGDAFIRVPDCAFMNNEADEVKEPIYNEEIGLTFVGAELETFTVSVKGRTIYTGKVYDIWLREDGLIIARFGQHVDEFITSESHPNANIMHLAKEMIARK